MLSKEKTLVKAKLSLALANDNQESFRQAAAKIPAWFDKSNFLRDINSNLEPIVKKIEPKEYKEKYLAILKEELPDFYYQVFMIKYEFNKDLNSALTRIDNLIETEGNLRYQLLENKMNYLLEFNGPDFLQEKANEELSEVMNELENA